MIDFATDGFSATFKIFIYSDHEALTISRENLGREVIQKKLMQSP